MRKCPLALTLFLVLLYPEHAKRKRVSGGCKQAIGRLERRVFDEFAGIKTDISGITSSIPEIQSKISAFEIKQKMIAEAVAVNERTLAAIGRTLGDHDTRINRNTDAVSALKKKDNSLWRMILELKSSVWEILEKLMQLMNRVDDMENDNSTIIKLKNLTETLNTREYRGLYAPKNRFP